MDEKSQASVKETIALGMPWIIVVLSLNSHWTISETRLNFGEFNFSRNKPLKIFAAVLFIFILYSLGSALYYMYNDKGNSTRMVKSLSIRIGLSLFLFIVMMISYRLNMDTDCLDMAADCLDMVTD
ncbi:twin transmembrane helix small protein [Nitrosomonas sp. Is24]|uniref:twin transmembrane helix small protein n=1 Tax=Nitrosomonas sp. Is24 TaxID=3080533 RepID=UPI0039826DA5